MLGNLNGWHLIIVLVVVLLLFGATRLPALSKGLAQSLRIFKQETKGLRDDEAHKGDAGVADKTTAATSAATDPAPPGQAAPAPNPAPAAASEAPHVEPVDRKP